jgi:hypothetical protein
MVLIWRFIRTRVVVGEPTNQPRAPFYGQGALRLLGHHLLRVNNLHLSRLWRSELTGWIGDDGIEEPPASPRILRDIKSAQVQNALLDAILIRGAHDARLRLCKRVVKHGTDPIG